MSVMPPAIDTVNLLLAFPAGLSGLPGSYLPAPGDLADGVTARPVASPLHGRSRSYAAGRRTGLTVQDAYQTFGGLVQASFLMKG